MKLLQRIIDKFHPDCGHAPLILELTGERDLARGMAALIAQRHERLEARIASLASEHAVLCQVIEAGHPADVDYVGPIESLLAQRLGFAKREDELTKRCNALLQGSVDLGNRIAELLEAAEESTGRIVDLEQRLAAVQPQSVPRARQLALCSEDTGGGPPIAEDEVVLDQVVDLPLLLIGIFFDQSQPGRPHHWVFRYFGVKAAMPIADKDFLSRVSEGKQVFRAGDVILASVHVITRRDSAGDLYPEFAAVQSVKKVTHAAQARSLFDTEVDLTAPVAAMPEKPSRRRKGVAPAAVPPSVKPPTTCACGQLLEKSVEREFGSCERCIAQDAIARRTHNGTLVTREQAAEEAARVQQS